MKQLPLEGIRVVDLTMMWAGPFATHLLAEMGAEVIKVEPPRAWDNIRTLFPTPAPRPWNSSFYFNDYNREKKSLTLDLAQPRGRELFLALVAKCDVVIENYRADVLDKLGLGYEVAEGGAPDVILVSMAGFGKTGADRDLVGFGPIIEQMAGLASLTGYGDDGVPFKTGISYGDPVGGIAAASALVLALIQRRRTGRGAWIDLAQRETMAQMLPEAFVGGVAARRGAGAPRQPAPGVGAAGRVSERGQGAVARALGAERRRVAGAVRGDRRAGPGRSVARGAPRAPRRARRAHRARGRARATAPPRRTRSRRTRSPPRACSTAIRSTGTRTCSRATTGISCRIRAWRRTRSPRRRGGCVEANPRPRRPAPLFGEHNRRASVRAARCDGGGAGGARRGRRDRRCADRCGLADVAARRLRARSARSPHAARPGWRLRPRGRIWYGVGGDEHWEELRWRRCKTTMSRSTRSR